MWVSLLQRQRPRSGSSPAGGRAAAPPPAPARRAAPVRAAAAATASAAAPKRADAAELAAEVERLKAENEALRVALAGYQKCPPAEVTVATAAAAAAEVAASPAAAPATAADIVTQLEAGIKWPSPQEGNFWERPPREAPMPLGPPTPAGGATRDPRSFHVVHITAEMAPHAKVGGLGDVVTGLARACLGRGHNVEIMLPYYECLPQDAIEDLRLEREFDCPKGTTFDGQFTLGSLRTQVYTGKIEGCPVLLVRPEWGQTNLFRGGRIYGGVYNEAEAYLYFSRACLEYLRQSGRQPDVVHVHEWQAAAVPMLFWDAPVRFSDDMPRTKIVMTIHNMDSSGECRQDEFGATGVSGELFSTIDKALDERTIGHNPERLCLLKGGMVYSNAVTTVSPNYAAETLHGGAAGWLKSTLALPGVAVKYSGVLNGIDTTFWDPAIDPHLPACYTPQQQEGKALCKRFLQQGLGMTVDPKKPLVAVISRLVPQKGIHLIEHAVQRTVELGGQVVVLGTGHADGGLRGLAGGAFREHPDVQMRFMYSEELAHQIYAAADVLLVPSMFEPCGLTQMIALRYGTVPVVRSTGGLADTVKDVDTHQGSEEANGYVFDGIDANSLNSALDRALNAFKERPEWWAQLRGRIMQDAMRFSWNTTAGSYVQLYQNVTSL
ncbi:hypothetical protein CHLNCDRAFT_25546 [Chlorella variabilis]|uniref:Starch synthase, chloroplastic/amyloplastic n=1 Tax=Chlorella variabilis TaxID=554065 RepID=E1ZK91_CHLVA|nr:hypothetical protein CHLNCDRAFT_25546 [Chlorella variabilis]EFN53763.1 hypothetical protein CHLNCDRAFT_25546 [Chlorella variabilis]|eukprot:XP_005845865.1 hypothetical protein CHLNCDRAFT_25546 [Chlorella variabilis]